MFSNGSSASSLHASQPGDHALRLLKSCSINQDYLLLFGCGVEEVASHLERASGFMVRIVVESAVNNGVGIGFGSEYHGLYLFSHCRILETFA